MIILLNGSFGVGKTTVAKELVKHLPNSHLFDPEVVGMALRYLTDGLRMGVEDSDDFQDIALWRELTVDIAARLQQQYRCDLIIPMTIVRPDYFTSILDGLHKVDKNVQHYSLVASVETINSRLHKRGDKAGGWTFQQVERCVTALQLPLFGLKIDTENISTNETVEILLNRISTHRACGSQDSVIPA